MRKERENGMKQDGRKLDHGMLEVIWKRAV
jgi:hypothetical protein